MDLWHNITNWIDHNRWTFAAIIVGLAISATFVGCQPKTSSIMDPSVKVSSVELQQEIISEEARLKGELQTLESQLEVLSRRGDIATADIQAQIDARRKILESLGGLADSVATGTFTPSGVISSVIFLISLLGNAGLGLDNLRKGRVITTISNGK